MNLLAAPFALLLSLLVLLLGGLGLSEASSACGKLCVFGDPVSAGMTGLGLVVAGLFSINAAASARTSVDTASDVRTAAGTSSPAASNGSHTTGEGLAPAGEDPPDTGPPR